ncbi:MAG: transcriptional regulator, partial [Methanosarcinales archaeon]|nr:transcriptional regulator [Methanosarcinales archaeon]
ALENAKNAVKDGGAIILVAECGEGLGNDAYERWLDIPRDELPSRLKHHFELGGHKAVLTSRLSGRVDLYLVSDIPDDIAKKAYFIPMPDIGSALRAAVSNPDEGGGAGQPRILVMPHGGLTCPVSY